MGEGGLQAEETAWGQQRHGNRGSNAHQRSLAFSCGRRGATRGVRGMERPRQVPGMGWTERGTLVSQILTSE